MESPTLRGIKQRNGKIRKSENFQKLVHPPTSLKPDNLSCTANFGLYFPENIQKFHRFIYSFENFLKQPLSKDFFRKNFENLALIGKYRPGLL